MYSKEFINTVKSKTDMVELAKYYIKDLKKSGEWWIGTCPNPEHKDTNPSFRIKEKDQTWFCGGCHHGKKNLNPKPGFKVNYGTDSIAFIQWIENVNLNRAIEILAKRKGIPIPDSNYDRLCRKEYNLAIKYHKSLTKKPLIYMLNRGLESNDIKEWLLGYDKFLGKITFPLFDSYKQVLGFTKRWINPPKDCPDKYRNSKTSEIFDKGQYLYGIHYVDKSFKELRITEGPLDVIFAHKYGAKNIVATLGTAFTEKHLIFIKRNGFIPVFIYDGDEAGLKAINSSIELLAKENIYSKILILPDNKDLADLSIDIKYGIEDYIIKNTVTYGTYIMNKILTEFESKIVEVKLEYLPRALELIEQIPNINEKLIIRSNIYNKMGLVNK